MLNNCYRLSFTLKQKNYGFVCEVLFNAVLNYIVLSFYYEFIVTDWECNHLMYHPSSHSFLFSASFNHESLEYLVFNPKSLQTRLKMIPARISSTNMALLQNMVWTFADDASGSIPKTLASKSSIRVNKGQSSNSTDCKEFGIKIQKFIIYRWNNFYKIFVL